MNRHGVIAVGVLLLYAALCVVGIDWGLPSRGIDRYLFGDGSPWTGDTIYGLVGGDAWASPTRGADVDADPIGETDHPVDLTATQQGAAAIYLRYRLYTRQPDEMITMRALGSMRPSELQFDPKLYQYGGLFIYPVGALLRLCGIVGLIDVRSDVAYYLDHPDEFGKFYVVSRGYAAAWGALGVLVVFAIARRLKDALAGVMAALLFTLLPVVVCMSHEGKPHLPGAVLMLLAVWAAMRYVDRGRRRDRVLLWLACGAALGMVLSSLPIFILMPLAEMIRLNRAAGADGQTPQRPQAALVTAVARALVGLAAATGVYLITNPYVAINAVANRAVLRSNFANSLAMYEVSRLDEGLVRAAELTAEGATLPVLVIGLVAAIAAMRSRAWMVAPLAAPAALVFVQFVLLGAGKPAEYGRFGVFVDAALAVATACGLVHAWSQRYRIIYPMLLGLTVLLAAVGAGHYLLNFHRDSTPDNTRDRAARFVTQRLASKEGMVVYVPAEPAPYSCPPLNFAATDVRLCDPGADLETDPMGLWVETRDTAPPAPAPDSDGSATRNETVFGGVMPSPISWANKPVCVAVVGGSG